MNEQIRKLAEQALPNVKYWNDELAKGTEAPKNRAVTVNELENFAELIVKECIVDFYRQYFDDEGDDVTVQVNRYIEDLFRGDLRLDRIEAQLRQQAQELLTKS
jgi:hypothetical protein